MSSVHKNSDVTMEIDREQLTVMVQDAKAQEGDEGCDCQQREDNPDEEEKPEASQPGPPVILQVHDVSDQGPECQHT